METIGSVKVFEGELRDIGIPSNPLVIKNTP